ncbi:hypothetical protein ACFWRR_31875 [Streptomyces cellulosae]
MTANVHTASRYVAHQEGWQQIADQWQVLKLPSMPSEQPEKLNHYSNCSQVALVPNQKED